MQDRPCGRSGPPRGHGQRRRVVHCQSAILRHLQPVLTLADVAGRYHEDVAAPGHASRRGEGGYPSEEIARLEGIKIVFVGNLEPYPGFGLLLSAFQRVAARHPRARMVIVGGSAEHISGYAATVPGLVDESRVHFLGPRPLAQLNSILSAFDLLASPRLKGVNTPMKIYSYLASGRAMLATRLPTHTQVVPEEAACLVDPDPASMAEGLSRLLEDPNLRDELGKRGRRAGGRRV